MGWMIQGDAEGAGFMQKRRLREVVAGRHGKTGPQRDKGCDERCNERRWGLGPQRRVIKPFRDWNICVETVDDCRNG